ncbi:MAG: multicopper oxidase family protein, partial [Endozoicomonas sp.]
TNLHTHGFHVSPKGSDDPSELQSDYVFIKTSPATPPVQYQFDLPNHHAPGTHWLHAHLHGSTAPQVKEGMAGALILKGEVDDTLEEDYGIGDGKDRTMILAQLVDSDGNKACGKDKKQRTITTSINGQCLPKITVDAGDINRWRFIHAGIEETLNLALVGRDGIIRFNEFARDGITLDGLHTQNNILLQPGYRSDVLVQFPPCDKEACEYTLTDLDTPSEKSLYGLAESMKPIATLVVKKSAQAAMTMPLANTFKNPYPFICDPETFYECAAKLGIENVWFANLPNTDPELAPFKAVNGYVFPDQPVEGYAEGPSEKSLILGGKNTWKLWIGEAQGSDVSHPFHIHVNPIQVYDKDQQFSYWKDTLLVSAADNRGRENAITAVSRYERFDGEFVLHCHNLDHEDQGMMMKVTIHDSPKSALQARQNRDKASAGHHSH